MEIELLNDLDECPGTRTDNVSKAVQAYLSSTSAMSTTVHPEDMHTEDVDTSILNERIRSQVELISSKDSQIRDLRETNGWLMMEYQKVLPIALPPPKEKGIRRFLKKKKGKE